MRYTDKIVALYMAKEETELTHELHLMRVARAELEREHAAIVSQRIQLSLEREAALQEGREKVIKERVEALRAQKLTLESKAKALLDSFALKSPNGSTLLFASFTLLIPVT